jgi:PAS domain S-box-containing protein
MWYVTNIGRWLRERPSSLMFWPVTIALLVGAVAMALFEAALQQSRLHQASLQEQLAVIAFTGLLAGAVAYVAMRLYLQLLRHTVDQAEERLRLSDQLAQERILMRALMDHIPDHIYFKDESSRFLRVNRSLATFFGLADPADAVGKTDFDVFSAEHAQQAFDDEQAILRSGQPVLGKVEKETWPDGRVTWASTTKLPLRDARGRVIGTFGISRDDTERVNRELQLRRLSLAVEQSSHVVLVTDVSGRITYVNPRFTEVTGYSSQEVVGQSPNLLNSGRSPATLFADLWAAIKSGRTWAGEVINRRKGGELYWSRLLISPLRDEQGQVIQFVEVSEDITARKEAEAARQAMVDGLRAVLEIADALIACPDLDGLYRRAVDLAREKLNLDRVALALIREDTVWCTFGTNVQGATTDERAHHYPMPPDWMARLRTHHAGDSRWSVTTAPLLEWDGHAMREIGRGPIVTTPVQTSERLLGVLFNDFARHGGEPDPVRQEVVAVYASLLANILARKQAEEEQRAVETRQRDLMQPTDRVNSLGLLGAGMAHEINNPLQGMLSHLHAAVRQAPPDFAGRESLRMVERGIETISGLVRKLLVMGTSSDLGREHADCGECVDFVVQLMESQLVKSKIKLEKLAADGRLVVRLPRRELCQVLTNLLINARDAMPQGGRITMEARRGEGEALLSVSDTGEGIAPENIRHLFTPLFTTKGGRGSGLGLPVADSLVRGCGGRIEVESDLGRGSTFRLHLPLLGE